MIQELKELLKVLQEINETNEKIVKQMKYISAGLLKKPYFEIDDEVAEAYIEILKGRK